MLCQFSRKSIDIILVECNKYAFQKMFKTLDKGSIITFSRGFYRELTRYCEVLETNVFPICQYIHRTFASIRQYSQILVT